jgi:DNA recombination protein RmuC
MEIALIVSLLISCILAVFLLRRQSGAHSSTQGQIMLLVQQQTDSLRSEIRENLHAVTENLNRQLQFVGTQLQVQTQSVGNRLDNAAQVIGDVQKNLGELGKATQEIKELGENVSKLDNLLRAPKLRGGLGEYLLEDLLRQVLPASHFSIQHRFRNGAVVDAVIQTSDRLTPVDSKFPLENFRRMTESATDEERRSYHRAFVNDVRKHIDSIADKYILPDEGTFPFALMYIPAENIYYEIILNGEKQGTDGVYSYAMERKVIPVSPNSFYAYLLVITLGLRGLKIEERAKEIQNTLCGMQGDISRLRDVVDTLGIHLENAHRKFDDVDKHLVRFEGKLEKVADSHVLADDPAASGPPYKNALVP